MTAYANPNPAGPGAPVPYVTRLPYAPQTALDADARRDRIAQVVIALLVWAGLLLVTYWWVADGGILALRAWDTGWTAVGRLAGLWSADLLLIQVLLMSRLPPLEHAVGRDRLTRLHRIAGFTSFDLMLLHIVAIVIGYAGASWRQIPATAWDLVTNYGGVLLALAGSIALGMVAFTSIRRARRRLRYESWHLLHLYAYLGVGLALPHQLWTGQEFLTSRAATVYWWSLWIAAAGCILVWRLALPVVRSLRHRLRVSAVVRESSDVVSVELTGRSLDRLSLRAGQFLNVRFLDGPGWTRSNPFSLSAAPNGHGLRITAKALGAGSARLAGLQPGTRVMFEGPYGRLSSRVRTRPRLLLIGAGVGITPIRALAEGLDYAPGEAILLQRYATEPLFAAELAGLAAHRGLHLVDLPGARERVDSVFGPNAGPDEFAALRYWVPDVADRDVFLCGPAGWTQGVEWLLHAAGVPADHIHTETFGW